MSDEQHEKKTRKANPYTAYAKAKAEADKVRRAAARAGELAEKAREAADKAAAAKELLPAAEAAEKEAYEALQAALTELGKAAGDEVADAGE